MLIGVAALVTWYLFRGSTLMLVRHSLRPARSSAGRRGVHPDPARRQRGGQANIRWIALATTVLTFLVSLVAWGRFDTGTASFQLVESHVWLSDTIRFKLGVDGFSMPFVLLTTFLMPFCILASWDSIENRVKEYFVAFLVLETLMIGVFAALDLVLFYLFFEAGLIPMFLIIGIWGGKRRIYASFKFFLYTLLGSVLMLLAIMAMYWAAGTTDIPTLLHIQVPVEPADLALARLLRLLRGEDADVAGAHLAAGRARRGADGRLGDPGGHSAEDGRLRLHPCVDADVPGGVGLFRADGVRAVGHRHRLHVARGADAGGHEEADRLFVGRPYGLRDDGHLQHEPRRGSRARCSRWCRHGLVSGALFLCVGVVYDRLHTREISAYGGLVERMPLYAVAFMVFTMANVGLPGTSGFVGEFLTLLGAFRANTWVSFFATTGVILSAGYALWLYRRVVFGVLDKPQLKTIADLNRREMIILAPLVLLVIYYGVQPAPILDAFAAPTEALMKSYEAALATVKTAALAAH